MIKYPSLINHYRENDIEKFKNTFDVDSCQWVATEKLHGCLEEHTMIKTREMGEVSIKQLVEIDLSVSVLSYNHRNNEVEWDKITHTFCEFDDNKQWYEVELEDGTNIIITSNHKVWSKLHKDYVSIGDLTEEETDVYFMKR